ncbi:MAG: caspase family protein [Proteobacteria bacterium]|nr:caspase family protein [Pseudomonadota bacterium]MBU1595118.1 caspase family protein [Pseudomonadota bacterium]
MRSTTATIVLSLLLLWSLAPCAALAAPNQPGEERYALVIGNSAYKSAPLKNPSKDARDMAALLKALGFNVTLKVDAGVKDMEEAVREFGLSLRKGGVGLFYFAGHGLQVAGNNYLVPVDAKIQTESDVRFECVDAGRVLGKMEDAGNPLNIVILDACRNNPFARSFRSADRGLAEMRAPTGSIIAYATAPGSVASDGTGDNGIYTKHLLQAMRTPGLPITDVFMRVRMGVVADTAKKQVPWESSSLTGYFYLSGEGQPGQATPPAPALAALEPVKPTPALPSVDIRAEKKRMAEEAERLKREKQELTQLQSLKAERDRLEAERQKIEEAKLLALGSRPKQPPQAQQAAPAKAPAKSSQAANAPYFALLARHGISDAQRYFESAVQARPEDADARAGLAVALLLTKREADAKYQVRRVEESGQTTPGTRVARGFMLGMEGQLSDSSYQLNRALEEGADKALVQLAMATASARKNELDQAKKAMEEYRSLVPPMEQNDYAKELANRVDTKGRLVGTFYWTQANKAISAYSSTLTFVLNGDELTGTAGGYTTGTLSDIKISGKVLTFRFHYSSGIFSGYYDFTCDLAGDMDTIPLNAIDSTFGGNWQGYLIRQGSMAQNLAYHANPGDCFIATAAYGEPFEEHVSTLRRFRDGVLVDFAWGRDLVELYYRTSPPLAEAIRQRPWARAVVRGALAPVVLVAGAATGDAQSTAWLGLCAGLLAAGVLVLRVRRRARQG